MSAPAPAGLPVIELLLILPLAALLAAVLLGRHGWRLMPAMALLMPLLSLLLVTRVAAQGPFGIELGGWSPPLGIALRADGLAAAFLLLAATVAAAAGLMAVRGMGGAAGATREGHTFWPLLLALWAALNGIFLSADLFNLYVALELLTLSAVGLVALGSIAAAMRYLVFALLGSLAYLLGVVLLYARYGTLDLALLAAGIEPEPAAVAALALMTAGLLVKTALFPLHAWLPPAHAGAPPPASAVLSALVVKASFYITARLWLDLAPHLATTALLLLLGSLGALAIIMGSVLAIRSRTLKLLVAYSTVAQLGYLFLIFPLAGGAAAEMPWAAGAWSGGMLHGLAHGLAKAAMFLAAGLMVEAIGDDRLESLAGIARDLPLTSFAFALAAVSLMGLPPSGGFIAKYLLLTAAFAGGGIAWGIVILAGGLLAAVYLMRPLLLALVAPPERVLTPVARRRELVPMALALLAVGLGVLPESVYALLQIGRPEVAMEGLE